MSETDAANREAIDQVARLLQDAKLKTWQADINDQRSEMLLNLELPGAREASLKVDRVCGMHVYNIRVGQVMLNIISMRSPSWELRNAGKLTTQGDNIGYAMNRVVAPLQPLIKFVEEAHARQKQEDSCKADQRRASAIRERIVGIGL